MPAILTFRFPLKNTVKENDIRLLINQWIHVSRYYDFKDAEISADELESDSHSLHGDNDASLHHYQIHDEETGMNYLAFRLTNHDSDNLIWRTDVIYESHKDSHSWLLINHSRSIHHMTTYADCRIRVKYPTLVKLLYDHCMVDSDAGLPLNQISFLNELNIFNASLMEETSILSSVFQDHLRTEFPFLYVFIPEFDFGLLENAVDLSPNDALDLILQEQNPVSVSSPVFSNLFCILLRFIARVTHVYIARTEADEQKWCLLTGARFQSGKGSHINLSFPGLCLEHDIAISDSILFSELYRYLILLLQECGQNIPLHYPSWESLPELANDLTEKPGEESYYIYMNIRLANAIQTRRKELHITQGDLAETLGCTKMLVSRLERMQTIKVRRTVIQQIEKVLMLSPDTLIRLQGKEKEVARKMDHIDIREKETMPRFCKWCGKMHGAEGKYCEWCGKEI